MDKNDTVYAYGKYPHSFYENLLTDSSYKDMSYSEEWKLFNHGES